MLKEKAKAQLLNWLGLKVKVFTMPPGNGGEYPWLIRTQVGDFYTQRHIDYLISTQNEKTARWWLWMKISFVLHALEAVAIIALYLILK